MMIAGPSGVASENRAPLPCCGENRSSAAAQASRSAPSASAASSAPSAFSAICTPGAPRTNANSRPRTRAVTREPPSIASTSISRASQSARTAERQDARAVRDSSFGEPFELRRVAVERPPPRPARRQGRSPPWRRRSLRSSRDIRCGPARSSSPARHAAAPCGPAAQSRPRDSCRSRSRRSAALAARRASVSGTPQ